MASSLAEYPDFKGLAQRMEFLVFPPKNYHLREQTGRQAKADRSRWHVQYFL